MKISDVAKFFALNIVRYTDLFSDSLTNISSTSIAGSTVTVNTSGLHNLNTGDFVSAPQMRLDNPIVSVTQVGQDFRFTTNFNHDLTFNHQENIKLSGFTDSVWNGDAVLAGVPNRKEFIVSGKPGLPTLNGNEILEEVLEVGTFGASIVPVTVNGITQFSFDAGIDLTGRTIELPQLINSIRVAACVDINRAIESYTHQNTREFWAFVTPESASLSKDRRANTDAISENSRTTSLIETFLDGFRVYIFAPCSNEISAVEAVDTCRHDLLAPMLKTFRGIKFSTGVAVQGNASANINSHGIHSYERAFLVYVYSFQFRTQLSNADANRNIGSVAFRDINYIQLTETGVSFGNNTIDLDEEPL